ncbi:hypothetical protein [Rhodovulum sulfidophilum]|nr:hypothetical protein [Rhodovulum sulfidophilum]
MNFASTEAEVTCEDGRKGRIRATLKIRDARSFPVHSHDKVAAE